MSQETTAFYYGINFHPEVARDGEFINKRVRSFLTTIFNSENFTDGEKQMVDFACQTASNIVVRESRKADMDSLSLNFGLDHFKTDTGEVKKTIAVFVSPEVKDRILSGEPFLVPDPETILESATSIVELDASDISYYYDYDCFYLDDSDKPPQIVDCLQVFMEPRIGFLPSYTRIKLEG
jgi:hypothetical protein